MTALIGAVAVMLVYAGGAISTVNQPAGIAIMALGVITLGTMFAFLQYGGHVYGFDVQNGLTVGQLQAALLPCKGDMPVYVGDQGLNAAGCMFEARLDGVRVFVIERKAADTPPATNVFTDNLF